VVGHRNELAVPVSVHLHGGRTPPEHDGYPTDLLLPAGQAAGAAERAGWSFQEGAKEYAYPMEQRAATLWYHDHRMDFTGPQVYRGLAGFHIVRDDEGDALPLPAGDKDIPLMICDRAFAADGSLRYPARDPAGDEPGVQPHYMEGVLGDVILVNGAPVLEVANTRYRFRLLNASNARHYRLALGPGAASGRSIRPDRFRRWAAGRAGRARQPADRPGRAVRRRHRLHPPPGRQRGHAGQHPWPGRDGPHDAVPGIPSGARRIHGAAPVERVRTAPAIPG
jgi:hypothetical protein